MDEPAIDATVVEANGAAQSDALEKRAVRVVGMQSHGRRVVAIAPLRNGWRRRHEQPCGGQQYHRERAAKRFMLRCAQIFIGSRNHRNYNALVKSDYASSSMGSWGVAAMLTGGIAGCAGVVLDALSAHALQSRLTSHDMNSLTTAARYLMLHGLLLIVIAGRLRQAAASRVLKAVVLLAATGIVLFCGGLTAKVLTGMAVYGAAAPYGGTAFMAAWLGCALHAVARPRSHS
ncbi:MAG: DUF423 domain-containing protein [Proteobacteria bacterium]|nr:DUF423 domain-containing protein [Pseudomonadota bacterium]